MNFHKFLYGNNHQIPLPIKVEAFPNSGALDDFPQVTAGSVAAASGSASKEARGLRGLVWLLELWTGIYWIYPVNSQLDPEKSMKITV
jgi:hypothetical protein